MNEPQTQPMTQSDGGPAFPFVCHDLSKTQVCEIGMSLRAWFAGQALSSLDWYDMPSDRIAIECTVVADALLAELAKEKT